MQDLNPHLQFKWPSFGILEHNHQTYSNVWLLYFLLFL